MIACHDHERPEDNLVVSRRLHFFDDCVAGGVFRFSLNGSDECVFVPQLLHLCLHLVICYLCRVRCSVSQEDKRRAVFLSSVEAVVASLSYCRLSDGLCDGFFVGVDLGRIRSDRSQEGLRYFHRLKHAAEIFYCFCKFIVLRAVHQVRGLDDQLLHAVCRSALERLLHVVDLLTVSGLHVINDDLGGKCPSHRPVGVRFLQRFLDPADVRRAAVIEGCSETHDQKFLLTDLVAIKRVVLRRGPCICAKIVRIREFSLNKRFLLVRKGVPGRLGFLAHLISLFGPLLHIDRVDLIGSCFCRLQVLFAGRLCGCSGISSVLSLLTVRGRFPGRSFRRVSRDHLIERNRIRYDDLVVIPFSFCSDQSNVKFLI